MLNHSLIRAAPKNLAKNVWDDKVSRTLRFKREGKEDIPGETNAVSRTRPVTRPPRGQGLVHKGERDGDNRRVGYASVTSTRCEACEVSG